MSIFTKSTGRLLSFPSAFIRNASTGRLVQEVRIPTPAGYVAGKWWGPPDRRPIVTLHGWQDNCGSFDRFIPLLPEHIPVLALDCPGHGYSYKTPPGIPYRNSDIIIILKELINYFGWNKISLMGHSLGAILSYTYGFLFPKEVDFLICIDGFQPLINPKKLKRVALSIDEFIKYDKLQRSNEEPPSYTIEEMKLRLHKATNESIALDTAIHILERNITPSKIYPGKFYFSRDARLKVGPFECPDPVELLRIAADMTFPIFICKAEKTPFFGSETIFYDLHPILEKSSADFQYHCVPGTHHAHLNEPEVDAGLITAFIMKHDINDRNTGGMKPEIVYDEHVDYSLKNAAVRF